MGLVHNLKMRSRLVILVGFALLCIIVTASAGMINNKRLATDIDFSYQAITRPLAAVANARAEFNTMRTGLYDLAQDFNSLTQNQCFKEEIMNNLASYEQNIILYKEILDTYGTDDPYEAEAVMYLYGQLAPLREYVEHIVSVAEKTGLSASTVLLLRGDFLAVADDIRYDLTALTEILEAQTYEADINATIMQKNINALLAVTMIMGSVFLLLIAYIIVVSITKPLGEITSVAGRIAQGELDIPIEYHSKSELGILADGFRHMMSGLKTYLDDKLKAERAAHEAELARLELLDKVHYDALTGLYNRRYLDESIVQLMGTLSRAKGMLSVIMLDIDFFKRYNDTYGHDQGDDCLKTVAEAIDASLSRADDFAVRYGGEEFTVILPNTAEEGAKLVANRILDNVRALGIPHEKSEAADYVTVSIGLTTGKVNHMQSGTEYIKRADEALYASKQSGRDRYSYMAFGNK